MKKQEIKASISNLSLLTKEEARLTINRLSSIGVSFRVIQIFVLIFLLYAAIKVIYFAPKCFLFVSELNQNKSQIIADGKQALVYKQNGQYDLAVKKVGEILDKGVATNDFFAKSGQNIRLFNLMPFKTKTIEEQKLFSLFTPAIMMADKAVRELPSLDPGNLTNSSEAILDLKGLEKALPEVLGFAQTELPKIKGGLDQIDLSEAGQIKKYISTYEDKIVEADFLANKLQWLFAGKGGKRDILVIFQNNDELRGGSGGSFGSFGVANFESGKLENIDFGSNIYKLDNAFKGKQTITPPSELEAFGDAWTMKQAGFAVDGKEALDKIRWFYQIETGQTVDGAVTIDTTAFTALMRLIGPIAMPDFGVTLDSDNFVQKTEYEVQEAYFDRKGGMEENEPKKILGAMMPIVVSRVKELVGRKDGFAQLTSWLNLSLKQKNILLNFSDQDLQNYLTSLNWTGQVQSLPADYLYVNNSNLAGDKTNQSIKETINLSATIDEYGSIVNSVELTRQHTKPKVWPNGLDRNYVRVLIPANSTVKSFTPIAGNFQRYFDRGYKNNSPYWTDKEAGRSTINFWMSTQPLQTSSAKFTYTTSYKVDASSDFTYKLLIQNQPGAPADHLELVLSYPEGFEPKKLASYKISNNKISLDVDCNSDKLIMIDFVKK